MIRQLNETRVQLEETKQELKDVIALMNESLDESIRAKIEAEQDEEKARMKELGDTISEIFADE